MATLIGLCIRVKLLRSLAPKYKVTVKITPGTHNAEEAGRKHDVNTRFRIIRVVNKQLNDKERVAAALENNHLLDIVNKCIANTDLR